MMDFGMSLNAGPHIPMLQVRLSILLRTLPTHTNAVAGWLCR